MDAKILVINADDLGFSADINAAIEEAHRAGRVTSASLMVDGKEIDGALAVLGRNSKLGAGLHLDLCPAIGFYNLPYQEMRENLLSADGRETVAREVERQIQRFKGFGLEFTHMDGHRHFHALPEIFSTVVEVAVAQGLRTIRWTKDWILPRTPSVYWDEESYCSATGLLKSHGVIYPGKFVYHWKEYSVTSFEPGINELMVHVGYEDSFYLGEYQRIMSDVFPRELEDAEMQLRSYRDIAFAAAGL